MVDVEQQLRAYGDAVEHASSDSSPEPSSRRGVFRGTLVAAAVVVLALAAVGAVLVARRSDDGRTRTASTRPRTRHDVAPVTATVRLDANVVPAGEDILGTVTFHNRAGTSAQLMYRCSPRWTVQLGGIDPPLPLQRCPSIPPTPNDALIPPGRSVVRFAVPTSGRPLGTTTVWVTGTRATTQVTIASARNGPTPCTVADLTISDDGIVSAATEAAGTPVHRLVATNRGGSRCRLVGAPLLSVRGAGAGTPRQIPPPAFMAHAPVILAPGAQASALVRMPANGVCFAVPYIVEMDLPDGGGRTGVQLRDEDPCVAPATMTNFVAGTQVGELSTGRRSPVRAELRIDATRVRRGEDVTGQVVFRNGSDRTFMPRTRGAPGCLQHWYVTMALHRPKKLVVPADCPQRATSDNAVVAVAPGTTSVPVQLNGFVARGCPRGKQCRPGYSALVTRRAGATKVWLILPAGIPRVAPASLTIGATGSRPPACRADRVGLSEAGIGVVMGSPGTLYRIVITNLAKRTCVIDGAPQIINDVPRTATEPRRVAVRLAKGQQASFLVSVETDPDVSCVPGGSVSWAVRMPDSGPGSSFGGMPCGAVKVVTNVVAGDEAGFELIHLPG